MDVTTWQKVCMDALIARLQKDYPALSFTAGPTACWSPHKNEVSYSENGTHSPATLLHELSHALLEHSSYTTDIELLHKEVAAWEKARELAVEYGVALDEDHIQDCLDTYRDWLHRRSICPACNASGIQTPTGPYSCLNCMQTWKVSNARLKRPYRRLHVL